MTPDNEFEETPIDPEEAALEAEFAALLEQHLPGKGRKRPGSGEVVEATVVGVVDDAVLLSYGAREEAPVPRAEFVDARGVLTVKAGDKVRVVIKGWNAGVPELSHREVRAADAGRALAAAAAAKVPVRGIIKRVVKGGVIVDVGLDAFMPASQVDVFRVENLDALVGQEVEAYVEEYDPSRDRAVISRRKLLAERRDARKKDFLGGVKAGEVLTGRVRAVVDFGVFIDFDGVEGLLPRAEISHDRAVDPASLYSVGQQVEVKVLEVAPDTGRLTLSRKRLQEDPWTTIGTRFPAGSSVTGTVVGVQSFGAFVQLEEGITGLIHVKDVSWDAGQIKAEERFVVGDRVTCQVVEIDLGNRRLALSLKHLSRDPWKDVEARYPVGSRQKGTVSGLRPFGAFVRLDSAVEGLVHVSDMSWEKRINDPSEVVSEGQEVEVVVLRHDQEKRRISLGIKQLKGSPFLDFVRANPVGSRVTGKVTRLAPFGAFIGLAENVEGLLHVSEIADERVESVERALRVGQEVTVKITGIDDAKQKVSLSRRSALRETERENIEAYRNKSTAAAAGDGGSLADALRAAQEKKKRGR